MPIFNWLKGSQPRWHAALPEDLHRLGTTLGLNDDEITLLLRLAGCISTQPGLFDVQEVPIESSFRIPKGWFVTGDAPEKFEIGLDPSAAYENRPSITIKAGPKPTEFAALAQMIKTVAYRGKRLHFSAAVRSAELENRAALFMRSNGRNMPACKALVRDVGTTMTVEPLLGLKVVKDLIVDMEPFFDNYKKMLPYFINDSPRPENGRERLQSPEQRARFDDTTNCILCASCTRSCPSFWASDEYYGPAALVAAHRFIFDSRDEVAAERMHIISETGGLARCHTIYNCTNARPRDIQITKAMGELKMTILTGRMD